MVQEGCNRWKAEDGGRLVTGGRGRSQVGKRPFTRHTILSVFGRTLVPAAPHPCGQGCLAVLKRTITSDTEVCRKASAVPI
jgi:hypothetical protein